MNISEKQKEVIEWLRKGNMICRFRGIGTRYRPSAEIADSGYRHIKKISVATVNYLSNKGLISEDERGFTHSYYTLSELGKTIEI